MKFLPLVVSIVICQVAGLIGSFFTMPAIATWYATLAKPTFTPPNWIFGPVWTILFLLMGISLYIIWSHKANKTALIFFSIQLVLNILWSILFFGLKSPLLAFGEILILWCAILITIIRVYPMSKFAAWLLMPYIAWVSFAAILNFTVYLLNT